METISFLKASSIPNWFVCAGFIQQTYFNYRHEYDIHEYIKDIDIAFFDPLDLSKEYENQIEENLAKVLKGSLISPDVKNQARVHLWYKDRFGYEIEPYRDIFDAIDSFPTTTTALGIRENGDNFCIYATFGVADLQDMILRPNKRKITKKIYDKKKKRIVKNWPKVKIIEWEV